MRYLFDTDICIELIRNRPSKIVERLRLCDIGDVGISTITLAELMHGVEKSQHRERNLSALHQFCAPLEIVPFDDDAATHYGAIRTNLEGAGNVIGSMDLLIATHARALGLTLVTGNLRAFARVGDLSVESWN